ncbi:MAG: hypothetical protein WCS17_04035 [Prevotella sp.]
MENESRTFARNARGVREVMSMKYETFPFEGEWNAAFSTPEKKGVWFIWGDSGNGKTTFAMQLAKELCKYGRVAYDSLEEGASLTMRNTMQRCGMMEVNRRFLLLDAEPIEQLNLRLHRQKSPNIVFIDSFQYTQMNYRQYIEFKEANRNKLLIFISHADGKQPSGRSAKSVMYDASLKIYVSGYRAFSKGRFIGDVGHYDIDKIKGPRHWGETPEEDENNEK